MTEMNRSRWTSSKLMGFVFGAVAEVGATLNRALVVMGDRLGYYRAIAERGRSTPAELAEITQTGEKYAREWLNAQAAGEYVGYDPGTGTYTISAEHAVALTDETSPAFLPGLFQIAFGTIADAGRVMDLARSGDGLGWHQHRPDVHDGCERFFRPGYLANLVDSWLPALDGVVPKLQRGARVADVGCGFGASTIVMAQAYPLDLLRLGLPRGLDRHGPRPAAARAWPTGRASRSPRRRASRAVRPGDHLRRAARHGRPGGRGAPRAPGAGRGRNLDDRRAGRRRPRRGQPQPRRPGVLRLLDAVCTPASLSQEVGLAPGHAGRPGPDPRCHGGGRVQPVPGRGADAVEHRVHMRK